MIALALQFVSEVANAFAETLESNLSRYATNTMVDWSRLLSQYFE